MMQSSLKTFASLCYRLLLEEDNIAPPSAAEVAAVSDIVGGHFNAQELTQLAFRVRSLESFTQHRGHLIDRWGAILEDDCSDQQAQAFLDDYFKNPNAPFDNRGLFDSGVVAGRTRTQRGDFTDREGFYSGNMPCWTLHFTVSGRALVIGEETEWDFNVGELILFKPDAFCHYGIHPAADQWEHYWVLFQPRNSWDQWLSWQADNGGIQHLRLNSRETIAMVQSRFSKLFNLKDESPPYLKELQYTVLEEMLIRLAGCTEYEMGVRDNRINQACQFMEDNLTRAFRIEEVADACNLSPSRLSHLFKDTMGVSLKAWVNAMRLQKARRKLLYSRENISQIAYGVGFEDANLFAKNFKKNIGCSPSEFRNSFSKGQ